MKKKLLTGLLIAAAMMQGAQAQSLYDQFQDPPQAARPRVWWHWMDGNVSMEGIRADLDWMERSGIGGFHQFDAGGVGVRQIVAEKMPYGTAGWRVALQYAMDLAQVKGMETAVASAPGWSSTGGPWVKPEDAMKKLTWRSVDVTGPGLQVVRIPELFMTPGKFQDIPDGGGDVVGDHDDGHALPVQLFDQGVHLRRHLGVQAGHRLVQQQ